MGLRLFLSIERADICILFPTMSLLALWLVTGNSCHGEGLRYAGYRETHRRAQMSVWMSWIATIYLYKKCDEISRAGVDYLLVTADQWSPRSILRTEQQFP